MSLENVAAKPRGPVRFIGSYADILRTPGAWSFVLAGWLGRIARSTSGIATILLVADRSGSFTLAGSVAAMIVVGIAVGGPLWSRAADARGQRAVLPISLGATAVAAFALVAVILTGAPVPTWFAAAFALGASSIDMGSLVRARWRSLLTSAPQRHTSLALESVSDELVFVVGPPVVTLIAASFGTAAGVAAGVLTTLSGGLWLWSQRATTPPRHEPQPLQPPRPFARRWTLPAGVAGLLPIYVGVGVVFATIDVAAVGVARETGQTWLAGVILAVFAAGSVGSGFAFGPLSAHWRATTRVLVSSVAYAVVVPCLLLFREPTVLASSIFIAGLVTTPVLISGTSLISSRVDDARLTEALTWPSIGLSVGITLGGALTGVVVDHGSAFSAFGVSACAAIGVGLFGVVRALFDRRP